ncbi:MAG: carboxypeptidase-like regulatory domain-containing protein, partial [Bacteroidales bacterium]|nr:carboxypeptidase-like regulatory domain-containing protein [Bacteroidales bacterium]
MKKIFASIALCGLLALAPAAFSGSHGGYAVLAQDNVTVSGTVVDENGEPILGAGIVVKGTTNGTTADLDGRFSLTVPAGSVIQFISVGFETVEKTVNVGGDLGNVTMP